MREIKFRAWDNYNQVMSYSSQYPNLASFFEYVGRIDLGEGFALMQYTGLKDKKGMKIYEGDIIQVGAGVLFSAKLTVEFIKYSWCLTTEDYIDTFNNTKPEHIKVIGNIYENKELVER